jgi:hypothetical protein
MGKDRKMGKVPWKIWTGWLALALLGVVGCASGPLAENPLPVRPGLAAVGDNPLFVPQGPDGYALVFDRTYDVIDDYFDIAYSNRFDGRIESWPLITAGFVEPWGLPLDRWQNLEATLQTIRRRAVVQIMPADSGGYHIDVQIYKELEDLPQPIHASTGAAVLRTDNPIERQYEVIDLTVGSHGWIPLGRDAHLEQVLLGRLKECL